MCYRINWKRIERILLLSKNDEWPLLELKGLGFRGTIFGKMLTYEFALNKNRELLLEDKLLI